MRYIILLFLPLLVSCDENPDLRTIWHNRESIKLLNEKNLESSQKELIEALRFDPFQAEVHINLGLNLELQKENETALKQYLTAEKYSLNLFHKFVSRFNRAQLLARDKKIPEALAEYQSALEIVPNSKEVKTNIELLYQESQGGGKGDSQDQKQDQNKDQNKEGNENKDQKDNQDQKDKEDQKQKKDQKKEYKPNQKYKPREFKGELSQGDVKKILDEIKQQEQKIRAEYNKKNDYKERPRDKDW